MFRLPNLRIMMFAIAITLVVGGLPLHGENILYLPTLQGANAAAVGLALVNPTRSDTTMTLTARDYSGSIVQGPGIMNPVTLNIPAVSQKALMTTDVFGPGISGRTGWVELSSSNAAVTGFFLILDSQLSLVDGADLVDEPSDRLIFPNLTQSSILTFVHTGSENEDVLLSMYANDGRLVAQRAMTLFPLSGFSGTIGDLFPGTSLVDGSLFIQPNSAVALPTLVGVETFKNLSDVAMVKAIALSEQSRTGYFAHLVAQGGYDSSITLVNPDSVPQIVAITAEALAVNGTAQTLPSVTVQRTIPPHGRMSESVAQMFNLPAIGLITGQIRYAVDATSSGLVGYVDYGTTDGAVLASVAPQSNGYSDFLFAQLADGLGFYTGLAILNANDGPANITLDTFDSTGRRTGSSVFTLQPGERRARLFRELLPNFSQVGGYAHLTSTRPVLTYEIFGSVQSKFLANVPARGNSLKPQPSGQVITSVEGANVFSADGSYLIVPPFALSTDTKIDLSSLATQNLPRTSTNEVPIGGAQGAPPQTQFDIPARLTFPLRFKASPGSQLVVLYYDAATGEYIRTQFLATVDESGRNASAEITQLGSYVIAAPESSVAPLDVTSPINIVPEPSLVTNVVDSVTAASVSANTTSLANSKTMTRNSANFYRANPVQHLWDRCWTTSASCTAGGMGIGSFWVEFDFGAVYNLTAARLFGDAKGTWWSKTWTLQYKLNAGDPWSTAFSNINAFFNNWSTQRLSVTARYVHVEVFGNPLTGDTEARELQIYGTPQGVNGESVNQAPTVNAGAAQTITLPSSATLNGTDDDDGFPVGTLTVTWSRVSGPGTVTFGNANALSTTASFSTAGNYLLRLTASDSAVSSASDVTITVNPAPAVNQPPTVNAGAAQTITLASSATLNGTAADDGLPAGSTLTTTWSKVSGPGTVTFGNANALSTTASFSAAGTYLLRLTSSDSAVASTGDVTITVNPAPAVVVFGYGLQGAAIGTTMSNTVSATRYQMASQNGTVTSMSVFIASPVSAAPNNQFQVAIYDDKNGMPGALLASSGSQAIVPDAWNTAPISAPVAANAYYWLTYNTNGLAANSNNLRYDAGGAPSTWISLGPFGTWPTNYGPIGGTDNYNASMYATVALSGPPVNSNGHLVDVTTFGAKGNGTNDDTAAIKNAIATLTSGDTLLFPCGTYLTTYQLFINVTNVTVDGSSCATIRNTSSGTVMVIGGSGNGNPNYSSPVALSATANELDTSFTTVSSLGVSPGDYVYLQQGGKDGSNGSGDTGCDPSGCRGEVLKVASVSGNTITVTTALHDTYNPSVNAATARKILGPLTGITIRNITLDGSGSNIHGFEMAGVAESTVSGVTSRNVQGAAILSRGNFNVAWSNITVTGAGSAQCGDAVWFENQGNLSVSGMSISNENPGTGSGCLANGAFGFGMIASANSTIINLTVDAAGAFGRPFKTTAARWNTFNSLTVKNGVQAYNGISLEYYSSHNTFNFCVVTNNGAGTGTGTGNAGINTFGNFNQYNTFNNCTVTGNGNVQLLINNYDTLRLGQDIGNKIIGGTYTGSNTVQPVIDINGSNASVTSATISGPGAQGLHPGSTNACVNNNIFGGGTGLRAGILSTSSTNIGSSNIMNGYSSNLTAGTCTAP